MTYRTSIMLRVARLLLLFTLGTGMARAQQYAIRSIDVPGAAATQVGDTNNSGEIVGCYATTDFYSGVGMMLANAQFTPVKNPKAATLCVDGISNDGKLAGTYTDSKDNTHGFLIVGKTYTSLDYPGAVFTEALKVNNAGTVVGNYYDGTSDHGFMWQSGTFTPIDYPGSSETTVEGINDSGTMVGNYISSSFHGFMLSSGTFTSIDYPGAAGTGATGINNSGQIVGVYYNTPYVDQGFTLISGVFSTVDYPGADITGLTGINDAGQVVGSWGGPSAVDDYDIHGFVATPIPGTRPERENGLTKKGLLKR
jgi:hypothetical protein